MYLQAKVSFSAKIYDPARAASFFAKLSELDLFTEGSVQIEIMSDPNVEPKKFGEIMLHPEDINIFCSLIEKRKKIEAIKKCRELYGLGLKEAKTVIDEIQVEMEG